MFINTKDIIISGQHYVYVFIIFIIYKDSIFSSEHLGIISTEHLVTNKQLQLIYLLRKQ